MINKIQELQEQGFKVAIKSDKTVILEHEQPFAICKENQTTKSEKIGTTHRATLSSVNELRESNVEFQKETSLLKSLEKKSRIQKAKQLAESFAEAADLARRLHTVNGRTLVERGETTFNDLKVGDVFMYEGTTYVKSGDNTYHIYDSILAEQLDPSVWTRPDQPVTRLEGTKLLREYGDDEDFDLNDFAIQSATYDYDVDEFLSDEDKRRLADMVDDSLPREKQIEQLLDYMEDVAGLELMNPDELYDLACEIIDTYKG
jgi:hypothetical protein